MAAAPPLGLGLVTRRARVRRDQVALVRYLLEAEDGLGAMYGDGSAHITFFAPDSQAAALDRMLADFAADGLVEPVEPDAPEPLTR